MTTLKNVEKNWKDYDLCNAGLYCPVVTESDGVQEIQYWEEYNLLMNHPEYYDGDEWANFEDVHCDEKERKEVLSHFFKDSPHYLLISDANWTRAVGYRFCHNQDSILSRDYPCEIYPAKVSRGKKVFEGREYSHDTPMGGNFYVIALTEREYDRLFESSYSQVMNFADSYLS